jgi:hypothetical protein
MTERETSLTVPVLLGSVRRDRLGIRAARLLVDALRARGNEPVLVAPMELKLPLLDRMYKEHPNGQAPEVLERLATLYRPPLSATRPDSSAACARRCSCA